MIKQDSKIILYGAGHAGRWALSHLRSQGIEPLCFVDSDGMKWGTMVNGVQVVRPGMAKEYHLDATWVACTIHHDYAQQIRADIARLGVKTIPLWEVLPVCHGTPSNRAFDSVLDLVSEDEDSCEEFCDQVAFRDQPTHDYDIQNPPSDIRDIYFPEFIQYRDDEHFLDCGAADGDTIEAFTSRWSKYNEITALEPDPENFARLKEKYSKNKQITLAQAAVSDHSGIESFTANGDMSSHFDEAGSEKVVVERIDHLNLETPPTYIKFDIEGAELDALWGARRTLKEHSSVLAVCAYHTSDHLWQIPLLIHAIQPDYNLFFRRYAEGAFEIVWYAVPPKRVRA